VIKNVKPLQISSLAINLPENKKSLIFAPIGAMMFSLKRV
jgi:hypothetical protein